ncbi:MAG: phage/plasmid primase, P4 family [Steroidobacter sp.]
MKTAKIIRFPNRASRKTAVKKLESSATLLRDHVTYLTERGITKAFQQKMKLRSADDGLLIPYLDVNGADTEFYRIRLIPAADNRKFWQPVGSGNHFYFAPLPQRKWSKLIEDIDTKIYIAEGELKAAALAQHGFAAIGIGGIYNWLQRKNGESVPIDDFELITWGGRPVVIVFDSDVRDKSTIQAALIRLNAELTRRGADTSIVLIPTLGDVKTGVDDFIVKKGIRAFQKLPERTLEEPEFDSWGLAKEPNFTDTGNSIRFVLRNADRVLYTHEWKSWMIWDGNIWKKDATEQVWDLARDTIMAMYREALKMNDSEERQDLMNWAMICEEAVRIDRMLRVARTQRAIAISAKQLDLHPYLIAVTNGVIDLKTGKLLASDPRHLLTKQIPVPFDVNARCPIFKSFLRDIACDDKDFVSYIQRVVGYLLTGDCKEQCFFVLHGTGANGKSTLLRVLTELFGDFATSTRMETWAIQKRNAGGPSEDIARLHGARLVSAVESEDEQRLAESLIKELTGQDRVTARRLYEGSFEFVPQFKLLLVCNHKPVMRGDDPAIWRRVRLLPFENVFPPAKQDKKLVDKLRAELSGILNWAIDGCLEWQRIGLAEPKRILDATDKYKSDSDVLRAFLTDCCETGTAKEYKVFSYPLYEKYKNWTEANGHSPMSATRFCNRLQDRGFARKRVEQGSQFSGLRLKQIKPKRNRGESDE